MCASSWCLPQHSNVDCPSSATGQNPNLPRHNNNGRFTPISRHIAMSVPRPARPTPASGVPIRRASKGRLFDQQYQDRFDKDYGAASAALLGSRFDVVNETFGRKICRELSLD
jgi:hypothetical protein